MDSSFNSAGSTPGVGRIRNHEGDGRSQTVQQNYNLNHPVLPLNPEDDGMANTRKRIHAIRDMDISSSEKARLLLNIMTEDYHSSMQHLKSKAASRDHGDNQFSSDLIRDSNTLRASTSDFSGTPYYLSHSDLTQTFSCDPTIDSRLAYTAPESPGAEGMSNSNALHAKDGTPAGFATMTLRIMSWIEKRRRTCSAWCVVLRSLRANGVNIVPLKLLVIIVPYANFGTMILKKAYTIAVIVEFAVLICSACIPISIQTTHRCIERSTKCNCPICGEYMFTSPEPVIFMRCGHSIHQMCFSEHSNTSYRCPICNTSVTNMETKFRNLDRTIESQPMPPEFGDTKALIYCNDCRAKTIVPYHWLGLKCDLCESYNTLQRQLLRGDSNPPSQMDRSRDLTTLATGTNDDGYLRTPGVRNSAANFTAPRNLQEGRSSFGSDLQARSLPHSSTHPLNSSIVVENYFGLSRKDDRVSNISSVQHGEPTGLGRGSFGSFGFWSSVNIKERLGLISNSEGELDQLESEDGIHDDSSQNPAEDTDEDEEELDGIDIFGHR
ncbi:hypothetical protein FQN57_001182 [Myotisia sp. PD_48]|nr:hypothetical protein FQN57_001182 [Myotisia sp. PD_48]